MSPSSSLNTGTTQYRSDLTALPDRWRSLLSLSTRNQNQCWEDVLVLVRGVRGAKRRTQDDANSLPFASQALQRMYMSVSDARLKGGDESLVAGPSFRAPSHPRKKLRVICRSDTDAWENDRNEECLLLAQALCKRCRPRTHPRLALMAVPLSLLHPPSSSRYRYFVILVVLDGDPRFPDDTPPPLSAPISRSFGLPLLPQPPLCTDY
ncbi:hypothetical protein C8R45DRAFT_1110731 [Mycena sanguinolenta]|nr:hypothetical protein C8R45DRAFT_1110731 [Mycena sanguinolenta]